MPLLHESGVFVTEWLQRLNPYDIKTQQVFIGRFKQIYDKIDMVKKHVPVVGLLGKEKFKSEQI